MTDRNDQELMQQVREGDLRKLAVLFERHHRALFHFFLRCTSDRELSEFTAKLSALKARLEKASLRISMGI